MKNEGAQYIKPIVILSALLAIACGINAYRSRVEKSKPKYPANVAVIELTPMGWEVRQLPVRAEAIQDRFKTMCTLTTRGFTNVNGELRVLP